MTRAISRDSFNELKQYIGVHLQQGRVILDSDWNEGQDIMATLARRLGQDTFGDGVLEGFEIQPVIPSPWRPTPLDVFELSYFQGHLPVSMRFPPTTPFDGFESMDGWTLEGSGKLRISRDQPYEGRGFLRLSDHTGEVTVTKTLPSPADLSAHQYAHFRYRLNHDANVPSGAAKFFIEDTNGNRNLWPLTAPWAAKNRWFQGAALPLDLRFHLFGLELLPAIRGQPYNSPLITFPATSKDVSFSITGNRPPGFDVVRSTLNSTPSYGMITGTPTQAGTFRFTVNATSGGITVMQDFIATVLNDPANTPPSAQLLDLSGTTTSAFNFWKMLHARPSTNNGPAANLSNIKKYGFIVTTSGAAPAVWDFDALYFDSASNVHKRAIDEFVISGPRSPQQIDRLLNMIQANDVAEDANKNTTLLAETFRGTARALVGGYRCSQQRESLYTNQRDPHDPPISGPTNTGIRRDLVYLDVTREPVNYIEDPELREIALGGPDTSTRMQIRQQVRVAPGGELPGGGGVGRGTMTTEGQYTDRSNRLYRVEIDTAGDIGQATLRWSDDNGSTFQRVVESVSPRSTKIKVEDASAFRPGDFILLRKHFITEEHRVAGISGNTITIQEATADNVTFALGDRPWIQRWNAFHVPIVAALDDSTVSASINLSFGVAVRFGGRAFRSGDFWTFRARNLAGDAASGIDPASRIEDLDFQPPHGVDHDYLPLALITRDPAMPYPERVQVIRDLRPRGGHVVLHKELQIHKEFSKNTSSDISLGIIDLGLTSTRSRFLCIWNISLDGSEAESLVLTIELYNNQTINPGFGDDSPVVTIVRNIDVPPLRPAVIVEHISDSASSDLVAMRLLAARSSTLGTRTMSGTFQVIEFKPSALAL